MLFAEMFEVALWERISEDSFVSRLSRFTILHDGIGSLSCFLILIGDQQ